MEAKYKAYCSECYYKEDRKKGLKIQLTNHNINDGCIRCKERERRLR